MTVDLGNGYEVLYGQLKSASKSRRRGRGKSILGYIGRQTKYYTAWKDATYIWNYERWNTSKPCRLYDKKIKECVYNWGRSKMKFLLRPQLRENHELYIYCGVWGRQSLPGWTNNLEKKRIQAHNAEKARNIRRKPSASETLVYSETFATKEGNGPEYAIKHMKRRKKLQLIENRAEIFNI